MTDTKCPFCNGKLLNSGRIHKDGTHEILYQRCDDCKIKDSDPKLWQELIRTRKALEMTDTDLAIIVTNLDKVFPDMRLVFETIRSARKRIDEITALEQGGDNE